MSRERLVELAHQNPLPNVKQWDHQYTCHMAALHWAWRALGNDLNSALEYVDNVCKQTCPKCTGVVEEGLVRSHASIEDAWYGPTFCEGAEALDKTTMAEALSPGDIVVCGFYQRPQHTMIVVSVNSPTVLVRGFNNRGTFNLSVDMRGVYDDSDRDLADAQAWEFGEPVCKIDGDVFMSRVKQYGLNMRLKLVAEGKDGQQRLHFPLPDRLVRQQALLAGKGARGDLQFPGRPKPK